jgi:hypothetical protein
MGRVLTVFVAAGIAVLGTAALFLPHRTAYIAASVLIITLGLASWKLGRPNWLAALVFGCLGAAHLIALWALRSRAEAAGAVPALETFGPGYLLITAIHLIRGRWFNKVQG